jgi:hypothetical protein
VYTTAIALDSVGVKMPPNTPTTMITAVNRPGRAVTSARPKARQPGKTPAG